MRKFTILPIFFGVLVTVSPVALASLPTTNGVLQTSHSLDFLLNKTDPESAYRKCLAQSSPGFFTNHCGSLVEILRKKMSGMALEADIQMQSEKIAQGPLSKTANSRIALLSKINLLSAQAEAALNTYDSKEDLPMVLSEVEKVQTSVMAYAKLFPNATH